MMDRIRQELEKGGAVVLPTETVYGLFAKALDEKAVNHVYQLKCRPRDKALNLNVDRYLMLGHGEEVSGGRKKKALLADAVEALIGALYLDSGFKAVQRFVLEIIAPQIRLVEQNKHQYRDYKSLLQEYVQKKYRIIPKYLLVETHGPDHDRIFQVKVMIKEMEFGPACGKNKKEAEQAAAEVAWKALES